MIRSLMCVVVVMAGCRGRAAQPSCAARVATMSTHLAAPRAPAELARVSKRLAQAAADVAAAPPEQRGVTAGGAIVPMFGPCPAAAQVMAGIADPGDKPKDRYLREQLPPALIACRCAVSPEEAGAMVELLFSTWR